MLLSWRTRWWLLLATALCLFFANRLHGPLTRARAQHRLVQRMDSTGMPPEYILSSALLGGFRSLAVQLLWYRAQTMKNEGEYYEMVDIYNIITKLQPGHHQAWAFQAWDLSYNVSVEFANLEDRVFWLFRGVDLLRLQGIPKNDQIPELAYECSWILQHKLGKTLDYAHPYYRHYLAVQMQDILRSAGDAAEQQAILENIARLPRHQGDFENLPGFTAIRERLAAAGLDLWGDWTALSTGPDGNEAVRTLVANDAELQKGLRAVYLWRIGQRIRERLGMDPARMRALSERYGPVDWRVAFAHSLYWAEYAYDVWWKRPDKKADLKYERLVYFSLIDMSRAGRAVWGEDGFVYYLPDHGKVDAVCRHMDEVFARFRDWKNPDGTSAAASLTGSYSGYHYFLRDAIFSAYFEGRQAEAEVLRRRAIVNDWQRSISSYQNLGMRLNQKQVDIIKGGDYDAILAFMPIGEEFAGTMEEYIKRVMEEYLESPTVDRAQMFLESHLLSAYRALALDDQNRYDMLKRMVDTVYKDYVLVRWPQKPPEFGDDMDNRHYISPLVDLRVNALMRLLQDQLEDAPLAAESAMGGGGSGFRMDSGGIVLQPRLKERLLMRLSEQEPDTFDAWRRLMTRLVEEERARQQAGPLTQP